MTRKTHSVAETLEFANKQLARTDNHATAGFKMGVCSMIEHVLHKANAYDGYKYNTLNEEGHAPKNMSLEYWSRTYYSSL